MSRGRSARPVIAIVGPTAAGKTALAVRIAERLGGEIVSCDSLQVYRELDIGSAKPSAEERARAPHHLLDVAQPDEHFSAARYVTLADRAIAAIQDRGRPALVAGGTGLYLRALRFGLFEGPAADEALRARLYAEESLAPGSLHRRLLGVDPPSAARISPTDLVRIVRALEIFELTGTPLSRHHASHRRELRHAMRVWVLDPPGEVLRPRIAVRVEQMLASGLVEETRRLLDRYGPNLKALGAVGYREVRAHLNGELGSSELAAAIVSSTRKYAKRQRTWFRSEPGVKRCQGVEEILEQALESSLDSPCRR